MLPVSPVEVINQKKGETMLVFWKSTLEALLDRVSFGSSTDETRPVICDKLLIEQKADGLSLATTDGHRIVHVEIEGNAFVETNEQFRCPVSLKVLHALMSNMADTDIIRITASGDYVRITGPDLAFEGEFPEYPVEAIDRYLNLGGSSLQVDLDRKEVARHARGIKKMYKKEVPQSIPSMKFQKNTEGLHISSGLDSDSLVRLEHAKISGDYNLTKPVGFNACYIEQALRKCFKCDEIEVQFSDPLDPSVWKARDAFKGYPMTSTCVIMPMRI